MNILNCINPSETTANKKAWDALVHCITCGFQYNQVKQQLLEQKFYVPEDQFNAIECMINIQMDLDIGSRRYEWSKL